MDINLGLMNFGMLNTCPFCRGSGTKGFLVGGYQPHLGERTAVREPKCGICQGLGALPDLPFLYVRNAPTEEHGWEAKKLLWKYKDLLFTYSKISIQIPFALSFVSEKRGSGEKDHWCAIFTEEVEDSSKREKGQKDQEDQVQGCSHTCVTPKYEDSEFDGINPEEIQKKFPRFLGKCPSCQEIVVLYSSIVHYNLGGF